MTLLENEKMISAEIPHNEAERIAALQQYNILDSLPEDEYDAITKIASAICNTPISLISLVDKDRQWFKSHFGTNSTETPREVAFCAHGILNPKEMFIVPDSRIDNRFYDNPLATGTAPVVFYAGVPLVSPQGQAVGMLCVVDEKPHEITDSQKETLKALATQVISLFELRKANQDLKVLQEKLETQNKELEQFAYVVSHDIKSPLANIVSFTDLIKSDYVTQLDEKGRHLFEYVILSATKLSSMVDSLLRYYRTDYLTLENKEGVLLAPFLKNCIDLVRPANQMCEFVYPEDHTQIHVNKSALEQITMNLLSNSIKYNDKDIIKISISFAHDENHYIFSISDNGIGIDKKNMDKIFGFFKILDIRDRFGNYGTGIGLSTVKKIIEKQGGTVFVDSELEKGTTFTFTIKK